MSNNQSEAAMNCESLILCSKCNNIPTFTIYQVYPLILNMYCHSCSERRRVNFESLIKKDLTSKQTYFCPVHEYNEIKFYCISCKSHLCSLCSTKHSTHAVINLETYLDLNKEREKIQKIEEYINDYYPRLKDNCIRELHSKIAQTEELFKKANLINHQILSFLKVLTLNYNQTNYYSIQNIVENSEVNLKKVEDEKNVDEILNFFYTNYILLPHEKKDIKTICPHSKPINSLCLLSDGRLASCSNDTTINVYNMKTSGTLSFKAHDWEITYISSFEKNKLISSSYRAIKIWKIGESSFFCEISLEGHNHFVSKAFHLDTYDFICSCSVDQTIRLWNATPPYYHVKTFRDPDDSVVAILQLKSKNKLIAITEDQALMSFDIEKKKFEFSMKVNKYPTKNSVVEVESNIIAIGGNWSINLADLVSRQIVSTIITEFDPISLCLLDELELLYGDKQGIIYLVDLVNFSKRSLRSSHGGKVNCIMKINENIFTTCGDDCLIKIWKN